MKEFLLEIYTEEVPSGMQNNVIYNQFIDNFAAIMNVDKACIKMHTSPLRLTFCCNFPDKITMPSEVIRGPKTSAPSIALDGFLKKYSINQQDLTINAEYYEYRIPETLISTVDILSDKIAQFITKSQTIWAKTMRWNGDFEWIRPIRNIVAIFDKKVINLQISGVKSTNIAIGHKFSNTVNTKAITSVLEYFDFI